MRTLDVDLAVIGFGKAGKSLVGALAARGMRVALIEQSDRMYGGTCINIGCVPTKALIFQAEHGDPHIDGAAWFAQAATRKTTLVEAMRARNFELFDTPETSTVITGRARFTTPHTLLVTAGEDELEVRAETIVVNTGAQPVIPPIPGLAGNPRVVTSTELLALQERPDELVVLGGGYIGVEFASMFSAFGSQVTLINRRAHLLPAEDPDIAAEVEALLAGDGTALVHDATIERVDEDAATGHAVVTYRTESGEITKVSGDLVLAALGRRPVTEGLGLEEMGIEVGAHGEIMVDEHLRTSLPHVFAVGDVNGGPQHTYISMDDHRIVLDQLVGAGTRSTRDRSFVPHVVFTTPPLARVGMTEAEARTTGRPLKIAVRRVADMAIVPRARIVGDPRGVMKAVVDAETDAVLGVTMLAHDAHETLNTLAVALRLGATSSVLRDGIYTHPSMTEAFNDLFANLA